VAVGETVFYRVRLDHGQRLRVSAETPAPKTPWHLGAAEVVTTRVAVYSPARVRLTEQWASLQGAGAVLVTAASPEVRVRNREVPPPASYLDPTVTTAAVAGDYFVELQVDPLGKALSGRVMQVRLSLAKVTGQPEYTVPSPSPTPSTTVGSAAPTRTSDPIPHSTGSGSAVSPGLVLTGAGLLALALVAAALILSRRRRAVRKPPSNRA
jgi:Ca-activated chloride channel family protein